jgi:hypothetical protein
MIILKIIGWILYALLKMIIGVVQLILTFFVICIGFGGGVFQVIGGIIGFVFVLSSVLCLSSGIVTVKEFWQMFFLGIAFGAIPTFITTLGQEGIMAIKGVLSRV